MTHVRAITGLPRKAGFWEELQEALANIGQLREAVEFLDWTKGTLKD